MTDILNLIAAKQIDENEASEIFDNAIEAFHTGKIQSIPDELCLNEYEWTAVCQGIDWKQLATWREDGFPETCGKCGKKIDYKNYGWKVDFNGLCHIKCIE